MWKQGPERAHIRQPTKNHMPWRELNCNVPKDFSLISKFADIFPPAHLYVTTYFA